MKALRFLRALPLALLLIAPARADQGSIVGPTSGPKTMAEVMTAINAGLLAIQSCNSGTTAPANGVSGAPTVHQCWADTSAAPVVTYKRYDGASWVAFGKLNTTTHIWTPVYQGTDTGTASTANTGTSGHTLGFLDGANTWSAVQSFNSAMLSLKGSTSGATTLNAAAAAGSTTLTLPAATDTLVGKATTDTFTNKTFDTAGTGNSFSINGLAATANTGTGSVVRATSPTLVTPTLGAATATTINGNTISSGSGTLTLGAGKTATVSNTLTFTGTDGSSVNVGAGGTVAYLANTLNAFASTTSAQLASVISDETGSGALVFGTSPTLVTPTLGVATATSINKVAFTAPTTSATLTIPDGVTFTGPAASGTAMTLGNAETVTGGKSFNDATLILKGATSGATTLKAAAAAGATTMTLPAATDTVVGKATTDTLTNKTLDTAGTGNSLLINGVAANANTGTGALVRAASPNITTPTGIVKGDVGLGNVDNTSDATKWAATKTLTNTTFDTAGAGNAFSINGVAASTNTGTGAVVRQAAPALTGAVDVQGGLRLSSVVTSTQLTANANDYTATDGSNTCTGKRTLRISTDASRNVTGLSCGQADGDILIVHNIGSNNAVLTNQDAASTAANRFLFAGDMTLPANTSVTVRYDGTSARWRAITTPGAGGGGGGVTSVTIAPGQGVGVSGTCTITGTGTCTIAANDNMLINGDWRINQRGYVSAATLSSGTYGHDRWKAGSSGGDYSFTQSAASTQITIAANKTLIQVVEDKNVGDAGSFTLSWSGTCQARFGINSATPSGGYAASPITISGQTSGTTMSIEFGNGASSCTLGKAKLEPGAIATTFVMPDYSDELRKARRYGRFLPALEGQQYATTNTQVYALHEGMRAAPSLSIINGTNAISIINVSAVNLTGIVVSIPGVDSGVYNLTHGSIGSGSQRAVMATDRVFLSSEL